MKQKIPLYLLESFVISAEAATLERAAAELGITQSTLSKQLILLEELLPYKLFIFEGRRKTLTTYGKAILHSLKDKILNTQEIINQTTLQFSNFENLQLRIGGRGEFIDIIAKNINLDCEIIFTSLDSHSAWEQLKDRKLEFAITHKPLDSNDIIVKPFLTNDFCFAIHKDLVGKNQFTEKLIKTLIRSTPCLLYKKEDPVLLTQLEQWKISIKELKIRRVYSNYSILSQMVSKNLGWAILPNQTTIDAKNVKTWKVENQLPIQKKFYLSYRKELIAAPWFKEVVEQIKNTTQNEVI